MTRYIDTADVAKMLRPVLRRTFPGVKFSVRISRYSGGSSVGIGWTDGPTEAQVSAVAEGFQGGRFEGMTDCAYAADSWHCPRHGARPAVTYGCDVESNNAVQASRCCADAELVHFSAGHVSTSRRLSEEFTAELRAAVLREAGLPADTSMHESLPSRSAYWYGDYSDVYGGVYRLSVKTAR